MRFFLERPHSATQKFILFSVDLRRRSQTDPTQGQCLLRSFRSPPISGSHVEFSSFAPDYYSSDFWYQIGRDDHNHSLRYVKSNAGYHTLVAQRQYAHRVSISSSEFPTNFLDQTEVATPINLYINEPHRHCHAGCNASRKFSPDCLLLGPFPNDISCMSCIVRNRYWEVPVSLLLIRYFCSRPHASSSSTNEVGISWYSRSPWHHRASAHESPPY